MITSKNLVHHEFIGLKVQVSGENNKSLNLKGTIIDETKNSPAVQIHGQRADFLYIQPCFPHSKD